MKTRATYIDAAARKKVKDINNQFLFKMKQLFKFKMKQLFKFKSLVVLLMLTILSAVFGVGGDVMWASTALEDGGVTNSGDPDGTGGISTETQGREDGDDDFYMKDVDKKITKVRPMSSPLTTISSYAKAEKCDSFICKFYTLGTRPIVTTLATGITLQSTGTSVVLDATDPNIFTLDDTIRVVGVKGITNEKGIAYASYLDTDLIPDLVLCVCGRDTSTSNPCVFAVNGNISNDQPILVPAIPAGTKLIRMGKACGELDVQTGRFNNIPTPDEQYCQNFMIQIEQSTMDKIAKKEVDFNWSDLEEDGIYDMKLAKEMTNFFGVKNKIQHTAKDNMAQWFTGGIWYQAGKDIEIGHWNPTSNSCEISDDDLVDISKDLFTGTGIGNKRRTMLCGCNVLATLSKVKSEKFRMKDVTEIWDLKFKSWVTDFGEILSIHEELFDICDMKDYAFALDPDFLSKKIHVSFAKNVLDLKKAGVRNTNAVVIQEVSALVLRYPKAHARMRLAQAPVVASGSGSGSAGGSGAGSGAGA